MKMAEIGKGKFMSHGLRRAAPFKMQQFLTRSASVMALALSGALIAPAVQAQSQDATSEDIIVTGSRRSETVQDSTINISAIGAAEIENLGLVNLIDASRNVPGIYVVDQGARGSPRVIVRGLNADPLASAEGIANDGGGTVATYVGEIPLFVNLKLNDMERVEYLFGPQGTLYGAGTLGGAIRYIPNKPNFTAATTSVRTDFYGYDEGAGLSKQLGITVNQPLSETLAFRASVDRVDDQGFIDYDYLVRQVGVSNPDPDFSDPADVASNLTSKRDANTEKTWSGRAALRWAPTDRLDATISYMMQDQNVGARQISSDRSVLPTEKYTSNLRVLEPSRNKNQLLALESSLDLGFADLTMAAGYSRYEEYGQRDQTDLLISLEYSYEAFPEFTAFTREDEKDTTTTFEPRLVSKHDGPLNYIVGAFYNRFNGWTSTKEFTPGVAEFNGSSRPDALEYYNVAYTDLIEKALYSELTYEFTPKLQVTGGLRYYDYKYTTRSATDFPLANTLFFGAGPDDISLVFDKTSQSDDGFLYKFNTSYKFTDDKLAYFTYSEGYRIGSSNGISACDPALSGVQTVCAQPDELEYTPDKTKNYELGARSQWFDKRLTLNGAVYYIKWENPQLSSATLIGLSPITKNGSGAESKGVELSFDGQVTDKFSMSGSFSYTKAELTKLAPRMVPTLNPPGFQSTVTYLDGEKGDRLPGSPEYTGSLMFDYDTPVTDSLDLNLHYGWQYVGDVETRLGGKAGGITLPSYQLHNVSARLQASDWSVTAYVNNLFDEFIETGARTTPLYNQILADANGDPVYARSFFTYVAPPRVIGIRFTKDFGG